MRRNLVSEIAWAGLSGFLIDDLSCDMTLPGSPWLSNVNIAKKISKNSY